MAKEIFSTSEGEIGETHHSADETLGDLLDGPGGAVKGAEDFLSDKCDTAARFDRVAQLVEGFEMPFDLELLATVHWVAVHENAASAEDAVPEIHAWNDRKKRFSSRQIGIAFQTLQSKGRLARA